MTTARLRAHGRRARRRRPARRDRVRAAQPRTRRRPRATSWCGSPGTGEAEAAVRRPVPLSELDLGRSESARRVLDVLTENRLLTVGGETVEVAHEALLREWPRLRGWLEHDAEARRLHRHITLARARVGRRAAATRASSTAARGSRPRWTSPPSAATRSTSSSATFLDEARLVSERDAERSRQDESPPARCCSAAALVRSWPRASPASSRSTSAPTRATPPRSPTRSGSARRR